MKKYILIISSFFMLSVFSSCSQRELELFPPTQDPITALNTEKQLQQVLNNAYFNVGAASAYGAEATIFGDLLGDNIFVSTGGSYLETYNFNFSSAPNQNQFSFYTTMYGAILNCNMIINNKLVANNNNVKRIKAEAYTMRGLAYFTLVNFFSPSPTSGVNQEYGVPLVLGDYNVNLAPARSTVAEVYNQIIADLAVGARDGDANSPKVLLGSNAAKILLARVYLSRRAAGDASSALELANQVIASAPANSFKPVVGAPIVGTTYVNYWMANADIVAQDQPETVWELDINPETMNQTGIGSNVSLPAAYSKQDSRRCLLANASFYATFANLDVRRGLFSNTAPNVPNDSPKGWWIGKYPRLTERGNYRRNIKVIRFSEAYLQRIEALHLLGNDTTALTELNQFAASRKGSVYTGANLQDDILNERAKELFAEGQRFLDLKRYNLAIVKPSNCAMNCNVQPGSKLYVAPVKQTYLNSNANLTQYPGY